MALLWTVSSACYTSTKPDIGRVPQAGPKGAHLELLVDIGRQQHKDAIKASSRSKQESCSSKRAFLIGLLGTASILIAESPASAERPLFRELEGSHGLKALDIREGSGGVPQPGDKVEIHYYARLAAKQGWRFDSTYDHKDSTGAPEPYIFVIGSGTVRSLKGLTRLYKL